METIQAEVLPRKRELFNVLKYLLEQFVKLFLLLVVISMLCFLLLNFSPIDPILAYIGGDSASTPPEQIAALEKYWGLDDPYGIRYVKWLRGLISGNLGRSLIYNQPVSRVIMEKFPVSLALMAVSWVLSGLFGFALGVVGALNEDKLIDRCIKNYCLILASAPVFWIALLMLMIFAVFLGWFPIGLSAPIGVKAADVTLWDRIYHLILPSFALSLTGVANIALFTRRKLVDINRENFMLFAAARGEDKWMAFRRHGFKSILIPGIMLQFASLSELFGGSTLAETVFSYPGLGSAVVQAGIRGDVTLLVGISLFSAVFVFSGNFIANLLFALVDPRIKEGYAHES
jgi:peptide/nickel transport system permease protein